MPVEESREGCVSEGMQLYPLAPVTGSLSCQSGPGALSSYQATGLRETGKPHPLYTPMTGVITISTQTLPSACIL